MWFWNMPARAPDCFDLSNGKYRACNQVARSCRIFLGAALILKKSCFSLAAVRFFRRNAIFLGAVQFCFKVVFFHGGGRCFSHDNMLASAFVLVGPSDWAYLKCST